MAASKFAALQACLCAGAWAPACGDSVCAQQMPSLTCLTSLMDVNAGCGPQATDCAAN